MSGKHRIRQINELRDGEIIIKLENLLDGLENKRKQRILTFVLSDVMCITPPSKIESSEISDMS